MALANTAQPLEYQSKINGLVYGYTDITFNVSPSGNDGIALPFFQIPEINYTWTNEGRQELGGTSPVPIGYTAGHVTFKGSFTISLEEDQALMAALVGFGGGQAGMSRVPFDITLAYGPVTGSTAGGQPRFIKDILFGCLIGSGDHTYSRTGGALMVKHDFVFNLLSRDGISVI